MQVSIIIVNYNTKELLKNCLSSIFAQTKDIDYEIIVSDNGSTDGSLEMLEKDFPKVIVIANGKNLGFGAANNRGLEKATGKYIFYLNSDTILLNNAVKFFYDYFEEHDNNTLGAIGGMLLDSNKQYTFSGGTFPTLNNEIIDLIKLNIGNIYLTIGTILKFKNMHKDHSCNEYYGNIDFISGADIFLKNNNFAKFDEDFFLYYEETFLQYKLHQANLERKLIAGPQIIHLNGGSIGEKITIYRKASFSRINYEFSRIKFLRKTTNKTIISNLGISFCKFLILLSWINPFIIRKTHKYFATIKNL